MIACRTYPQAALPFSRRIPETATLSDKIDEGFVQQCFQGSGRVV
jgi:hypothetical protein